MVAPRPLRFVLPAYAGMFPEKTLRIMIDSRSPRVCGDVSTKNYRVIMRTAFSPRMRGCFRASGEITPKCEVLPAYAGMFLACGRVKVALICSPRVCGDVSGSATVANEIRKFSPRMRGCFRHIPRNARGIEVLPAYAGMFPGASESLSQDSRSPRVCGDVSLAAR